MVSISLHYLVSFSVAVAVAVGTVAVSGQRLEASGFEVFALIGHPRRRHWHHPHPHLS